MSGEIPLPTNGFKLYGNKIRKVQTLAVVSFGKLRSTKGAPVDPAVGSPIRRGLPGTS